MKIPFYPSFFFPISSHPPISLFLPLSLSKTPKHGIQTIVHKSETLTFRLILLRLRLNQRLLILAIAAVLVVFVAVKPRSSASISLAIRMLFTGHPSPTANHHSYHRCRCSGLEIESPSRFLFWIDDHRREEPWQHRSPSSSISFSLLGPPIATMKLVTDRHHTSLPPVFFKWVLTFKSQTAVEAPIGWSLNRVSNREAHRAHHGFECRFMEASVFSFTSSVQVHGFDFRIHHKSCRFWFSSRLHLRMSSGFLGFISHGGFRVWGVVKEMGAVELNPAASWLSSERLKVTARRG